MTRKQRRMTIIGGSLAVLALAAALVLNALRDSIVFFSTPTMVAEKHVAPGKRFRLGGLVQPGSLQRGDNLAVTFEVADMQNSPGGGRPLRRGDEPARRDVLRRPLAAPTNIRGHHRVMKSQERRRRGNHHLRRSTGTCWPQPSAPWH